MAQIPAVPDLNQYGQIINQAAAQYNLDPTLIKSVIAQESSGNASAKSNKGAQGLMQLMPSIQQAYGVKDPSDPTQNIMAGTHLLSDLLDQYRGNLDQALMAYNAGSNQQNWNPGYTKMVADNYRGFLQAQQPAAQHTQAVQATPDPFTQKFGGMAPADDVFSKKFGNVGAEQSGQQSDDPFIAKFGQTAGLSKDASGNVQQLTLEQKANSDIPTDQNLAASAELQRQQQASQPKTTLDQDVQNAWQGAKEAALSAITGATTGTAAGIIGAAKGIGQSIANGTFGTHQAADSAEQMAQQYQQAATYQPQTPTGQQYTKALGDVLNQVTPVLPETAAMGAAGEALANAREAAPVVVKATAENAGQALKNGVSTVVSDMRSTPQPWEGGGVARYDLQDGKPVNTNPKNAGAAATTPDNMARATVSNASPELQAEVEDAIQSKKGAADIDQEALNRQAVADSFGIKLTAGQASRDAQLFSDEKNLRAKHPEFAQRFADQQQGLTEGLQSLKVDAAPDVYATTPAEFGDNMIDAYQQLIDAKTAEIDAKYQALRDAAGGSFPINTGELADNIQSALHKELLTHDAPASQLAAINDMAANGNMSFEQYLALRRNLGDVARTAQDGNTRRAAGLMIEQLENLPLNDDVAQLKPLADDARQTARAFYQLQAQDPALKAVVTGTASPDRFVNKYIINADTNKVQTMMQNLQDYPLAQQTAAAGVLDYLSPKGTRDITQDALNRNIQNVQSKLPVVMPAEQAKRLQDLGNVAEWIQKQPAGSYVNNSNTTSTAMRYATGAAEGMSNMHTAGVPVYRMVADKLAAMKAAKMLDKHLKPGAGIRYSERE